MNPQDPQVVIIIGSETDLPIFDESKAGEVLGQCGIIWELSIVSADRNPGVLSDYCATLKQNGVKVFIAGAGMAARLPGTIAAHAKYLLPVIGVALPSDEFSSALDSMLSIVRSPAGCPVLFAGIGKAGFRNAAIAAAQILSTGEDEKSRAIGEKLITYLRYAQKEPQIAFRKSGRKEK